MKSQPLRKDKHCLNCGFEVPGRYCTNCGQENTVQHETFGHLVKHVVMDIFHYDSQFLATLKYLLIRPGFLTREYMAGRRVRYVNPIKLYVFVSFVFFFTIFGLLGHTGEIEEGNTKEATTTTAEHKPFVNIESSGESATKKSRDSAANAADTTRYHYKSALAASTPEKTTVEKEKAPHENDSVAPANKQVAKAATEESDSEDSTETAKTQKRHDFVKEYEEQQAALPAAEQDKGFAKILARKISKAGNKYQSKRGDFNADEILWEVFKHNAPKFMFLLMPLFALMMKWLYIRRKQYMYADHAIFALHFHTFAFMLFLIAGLLVWIFPDFPGYTISFWVLFAYQTLGLYNNYGQSFRRSLAKSALLTIAYFFCISFVMVFGIMILIGLS